MILYNKFIKTFLIIFIFSIILSCKNNKTQVINNENKINKKIYNLIQAYPDFLKKYKNNYIIWHDGTKMKYNDFISKKFNQLLNKPDLEDQMKMDYKIF